MTQILNGLDVLLEDPKRFIKGTRIGLVVNHTSLAQDQKHSIFHFKNDKHFALQKLFAPEHGLYGTAQDMAAVGHHTDPDCGLNVISLYGDRASSLSPDTGNLENIDTLIFDIQDIGSRYYTFIYTMANCMEACRKTGVSMVVCDRPNPINGVQVEGNRIEDSCRSFVGQYPIANRHGMTAGELALLFNQQFDIGCDLTVVSMKGWQRDMWFDATGMTWVPPSPNMPSLSTATVYPGMCLVEGTQLSEGRGTTLPFEHCGAPFIDARTLVENLNRENLPGVFFRPHYFKPMFQKYAGKTCGGIQLHVTDRSIFKPVLTGVAVIMTIATLYPNEFAWRTDSYEFVEDPPAIDLLYGNSQLRKTFLKDTIPLAPIEESWKSDLNDFKILRKDFLIY
ncbi:MAG: DUF1343 domain-containing protein [Nitrospinota bacterium]|nr:DUF1343 domain-containing protein [Nitrospinota bacterium]